MEEIFEETARMVEDFLNEADAFIDRMKQYGNEASDTGNDRERTEKQTIHLN